MSPSRDIGKFLSRAAGLRRWATAWSSVWLAILIGVLMLLAGRSEFAEQRRERNFDLLLASRRLPPSSEIVIVDIDQRSLAAKGQWPWGRDKIAALIGIVADAKPRSIGIDTLIAGGDERSPAALARRLAEITGKDDIARLAAALPDGDRRALGCSQEGAGYARRGSQSGAD